MQNFFFKVKESKTLLDFLLKDINLSKNVINKIKYGCLFVNGNLVNNVNDMVYASDEVKIILPKDQVNPYSTPNNYPLEIIYEDEYFLAVVKPKGMLTHSSKGNSIPTLEGAVINRFAPIPFTFRGINRLDKDTSGIILIAKDIISASYFNALMQKGGIKKTYQAVIVGKPKENSFIIDAPIEREKENGMKRVVSLKGKPAITECLSVEPLTDNLYKAEILLHTGRTHQIRVHFAHIGNPLYADSLYGQKVEGKTYTLHAGKLQFIHPFTKEEINLISPIKI